VRESLYTRVNSWINAIVNHTDTRVVLRRYEDSCMGYRHDWYHEEKITSNIHTLHTSSNVKSSILKPPNVWLEHVVFNLGMMFVFKSRYIRCLAL
jgi:hypothetical protein